MTYRPHLHETITAVHKTRTITGIVTKVNRTKAVVRADGGNWVIPFTLILPPGADAQKAIYKNIDKDIARHTPTLHVGQDIRINNRNTGQWAGRTGTITKVNPTTYKLLLTNDVPGHPGSTLKAQFAQVEAA